MARKPSQYWKEKYQNLCAAIQGLHEEANEFQRFRDALPYECDSDANEFFISNVLECVDNEAYALREWGPGKYFKVQKCPIIQSEAKK